MLLLIIPLLSVTGQRESSSGGMLLLIIPLLSLNDPSRGF
jgi:hypothetical protein